MKRIQFKKLNENQIWSLFEVLTWGIISYLSVRTNIDNVPTVLSSIRLMLTGWIVSMYIKRLINSFKINKNCECEHGCCERNSLEEPIKWKEDIAVTLPNDITTGSQLNDYLIYSDQKKNKKNK